MSPWKDRFFFIDSSIIPLKLPIRQLEATLNEKEPDMADCNPQLLGKHRKFTSPLRTFCEEFLVSFGLSIKWAHSRADPCLMLNGEGMCHSILFLFYCLFVLQF